MNVLVCSAARFGIANVVYNVIEKMEPLDVEITYCRNPLNPSPKWCETVDLLNKDFYERLSSTIENTVVYRPVHLSYGILWYWRKAFKYIERHGEKYDVVWLHSPHPVIFKRHSDCSNRFVVTLHGDPGGPMERDGVDIHYYRYLNRIRDSLFKQNNVRLITGVAPHIASSIESAGIDENKVRFVRNGVDIEQYAPRDITTDLYSQFEIPDDHTVLLFLGRFSEAKRPLQLLKSFGVLKQRLETVSLIMTGEGELLQDAKRLVAENDIPDVYFPGYVTGDRKIDLYRASDIFVLSSKYEGSPLVLAEAMATGTPCIISDIEAATLVEESDCGIVAEFDNPDRAAQDLETYIGTLPNHHGKNARRFAESNLSWRSVSESYCDLFNEIMIEGHRVAS